MIDLSRVAGWLARLWNWKSALLSSLFRALIFLFANWRAGSRAAIAAMLAEFLYRSLTAGFYGTITQRLRRIEPPWRGSVAASLLLPAVGHSLEWLLHTVRGTPNLRASMTASVIFTLVSSLFHLFAMRRGHFIVGEGSRPLLDDLRHVPVLIRDFMLAGPKLLAASSPWKKSRESRSRELRPRARRAEEGDAGHRRRGATKLPAASSGCPKGCGGRRPYAASRLLTDEPASPSSPLLASGLPALATRPAGLLPRAARGRAG